MFEPEVLVSVIIPVYNGRYIRETLASVQEQTHKKIEIIVINDGSTDQTEDVVLSFKRVILINTENRGVASARNEGLRASRGEYVTFLDADDTWAPDKTERQVRILNQQSGVELVYGRFRNYFQIDSDPPPAIQKEKFLHPDTGKMISLCTLMARRNVFDTVGYFNENLRTGEDLDWFVKLKEKNIQILFDDYPVTNRRLHNSNISYIGKGGKTELAGILRASMERKRRLQK